MPRKIQFPNRDGKEKTPIMEKFKEEARIEVLKNIDEEICRMKEKAEEEIGEMKRNAELELEKKEKEMKKAVKQEKEKISLEFMKKKQNLEDEIKQEWEKIEIEKKNNNEKLMKREKELEKFENQIKRKNENIKEQIKKANLDTAEYKILYDENEYLKKTLKKYQNEIDMIKKRQLTQSKSINKDDNSMFEESIFDKINKEDITKIGQIILGENISKNNFEKLSSRYNDERIFSDGILLENGNKTSIIVIPNEEENNKYEFYSNMPVITKYNLLCIANFCLQIYKVDVKLPEIEKNKGISLEALLYSEEEPTEFKNCNYEVLNPSTYKMKYDNKQFTNYALLAIAMYNDLNCSKKNISKKKLKKVEEKALIESLRLSGNKNFINDIDDDVIEQEER